MKKKDNVICRLLGHSWAYKNCKEWMKPDGTSYTYERSRKCTRCNGKEIMLNEADVKWHVYNNEM